MPRTLFLSSPRLGIVNLVGERAQAAADEDAKAFGGLFGKAAPARPGGASECDVLVVYCELERDGTTKDGGPPLAGLVNASRAKVVVLAWNNPGDAAAAALRGTSCNAITTVDRRGPRFAPFVKRLFSEMFLGTPMPAVWSKIAPAVPDLTVPNAALHAGAGNIAFAM